MLLNYQLNLVELRLSKQNCIFYRWIFWFRLVEIAAFKLPYKAQFVKFNCNCLMKRGQVENTYAKKCHVARYKENFSNTIKMIDHWIRFSIDHSWNKLGKKPTEEFSPPIQKNHLSYIFSKMWSCKTLCDLILSRLVYQHSLPCKFFLFGIGQ